MSDDIFTVPCPICHKAVIWSEQSPYHPFCSKRCQLIDLGEWAAEEKAIPCETADFAASGLLNEDNDWVNHS